MDPITTSIGTLVVAAVLVCAGLFFLAGGDFSRVSLGCQTLMRTLRDAHFAAKVQPLLQPPTSQAAAPAKPSGVPLRLLALLQREGRLLDFLMEDVQAYPDPQIGAAVRDIHRKAQAALKEHLVLAPIMPHAEGAGVEVPVGFDPSAIRVTGNVVGQPPFRGTLLHHGWRVKEIKLAAPPEGQDELVLQPAEVEIQ